MTAFTTIPQTTSFASSTPSSLSMTAKKKNNKPNLAAFEYQELKIQLTAMKEQDVVTSQLPEDKRVELEGYIRRILNRKDSPIPLYEMAQNLPDTNWYLAYTTQALTNEVLPNDTRIRLKFAKEDPTKVDYILEFTKTFGLKRLVAKSSYTVDVSTLTSKSKSDDY